MRTLHEFPLLRLLAAFVAGIAIPLNQADHTHPQWIVLILLIVSVFIYLFAHFRKLSSFRRNRDITGILGLMVVFLAGYVLTHHKLYHNFTNANMISDGTQALLIRVISPPEERSRSLRMKAEVLGNYTGKAIRKAGKPRFMVYIKKEGLKSKPEYGDILLANGVVSAISPPRNPGQFDYRRYLEFKGILKQIRIKADGFRKVDSDTRPWILKIALDTRDRLLKVLQEKRMSTGGYAVGAAILLGYDDEISPELMRDYSDTGVIHVLCVSGMHVGIIYVLLEFLLFFLNRNVHLKRLKALLILAFIWYYSLVTGFSPSVLRSAAMFTFILAGQTAGRKVDIRNSLLASAFFLLLYDPFMITDIGFQLSYAAVFSIVLFNRYVLNWWIPRLWFLRKIWELTAVSISAQILVAPMVMFYFHKFSNYFIISNLVAIPLSTLVLYNGMLVLAFTPLDLLAEFFSRVMDWLIMALNSSVSFINQLPFSSFSSLNLSIIGFILIYFMIFSLVWYIMNRKPRVLIVFLTCLTLFLGMSLAKQYNAYKQRLMVFYSVQGHTSISFIEGKTCYTLLDEELMKDTLKYSFSIQPAITALNIRDHYLVSLESKEFQGDGLVKYGNFICFNGLRITLNGDRKTERKSQERFKTDFLYLTDPKSDNLMYHLKTFDFGKLITGPAHRHYASEKLESESEGAGIEMIRLEDGAYRVDVQGKETKLEGQ